MSVAQIGLAQEPQVHSSRLALSVSGVQRFLSTASSWDRGLSIPGMLAGRLIEPEEWELGLDGRSSGLISIINDGNKSHDTCKGKGSRGYQPLWDKKEGQQLAQICSSKVPYPDHFPGPRHQASARMKRKEIGSSESDARVSLPPISS